MAAEKDLPGKLGVQWGYLEHKIGEFSREFGAKAKKAKSLLKVSLEKELDLSSKDLNDETRPRYQALKTELDDILENEIKGLTLRSQCEEYEKGGKCIKYFFSLEKIRSKQKSINRLKLDCGSFTSDPLIRVE